MPDGGFLVKFDGKVAFRCADCAFDFDAFEYKYTNTPAQKFPKDGIKKIEIIFEEE
jgi:hypothetical protein